jgi:cytochrome oxidase Cu insertion factor (SCO1/SenC/PrrC family)
MRRLVFLAIAILLAVALFARMHRPAEARDHLTGIVLMAPSSTTIIVHHEPFAGMPAMTMTFAVPAGTVVHPGDHIAAEVDRSTDPWTLSAIAVTAAPASQRRPQIPFLAVGDHVPNTTFIDQHGRRMTLAALRGHPYALTFIYTRCQDPRMCPLVSAKVHQVQTHTAGTPIALVEVSLDPAFDRPPVLARYAALFGAEPARWHLLTGDPRAVLDFAARFRILERSAGPQTIVHSERLAVVDATGRITRFFDDAAWRPEDVERALQRSMAPEP